ncbi:hypothetical protein CapIbe_022833 [Capra ibex]
MIEKLNNNKNQTSSLHHAGSFIVVCGLCHCGTWTQWLQHTGLVPLRNPTLAHLSSGFTRLDGRRKDHQESAWLKWSYKPALHSSEDLYSTEDASNAGRYGFLLSFCLHGEITVNIVNYPKAEEYY